MSLNRRLNRVVHQAVLVLACSAAVACGDDSDAGAEPDAGTRDDAGAGRGGKGGGGAGKGGSGGAAGKAPSADGKAVTIRFRGAVADRDFVCGEKYEDIGSTKTTVVPADFRFFVQDVKLIDSAGKEVPVELDTRAPWQTPDVALIDLEDSTEPCRGSVETNATITGTVPEGEYSGVVFRNGVPEELNHLDQATQPAPLDQTDLFWQWTSGFRFLVAELKQDDAAVVVDADAGVSPAGVGVFHIGSTSCRKNDGCKKKNRNLVRLADFDPDSDVIVADIAALFSGSDLTQETLCHAADEICEPMFERAGINFADGESLDEQQLYRVAPARDGEGSDR
jgi:uncharacterized repeat protein (TIGR04052 family)